MKKLWILVLMFLLFSIGCIAIEPSQQYNKIFLAPFYRVSLSANTNVTYSVNVNPPDRISVVNSAIISFNLQANGQTQSYSLWVNGQSCNNPTYNIATAFSTTGQLQFYFDCSNIITRSGVYNITLRSDTNTGAISGWLDLTYMNSPLGDLLLHGTEYVAGDNGRMFLQFLDSNKLAISNSACTINIWYPNNTKFVNSSAMTYLDEGIYFYTFTVPSIAGVYPASAKCYYPYLFGNFSLINNVTESWDSNSFTGGSGFPSSNISNSTNGWDYYSANVVTNATAGGCQDGLYCVQISGISQSAQYLERGFITPANTYSATITFWLKSTLGASDTAEYDIFDGVWHQMEVYTGANFAPNVWYKKQYNLTTLNGWYLDSIAILQGFYAISWTASNKYLYMDNFTVSYSLYNTSVSNVSAYQVLMGSGEVHVSNLYSQLNYSLNRSLSQNISVIIDNSAIASAVWNASIRNLTFYQNFTQPQVDLTNYSRINSTVVQGVWSYSGIIVPNILNQIANQIWSWASRYVHGVLI